LPIIWVFLGGAAGSTSRWLLGEVVSNGVLVLLIVNVLGTSLAGWVGYRESSTTIQRLFWITGFAGGFTTFSSLAYFLTELAFVEASLLAGLTLVLSLSILAAMEKR
jgi:CrcB protein